MLGPLCLGVLAYHALLWRFSRAFSDVSTPLIWLPLGFLPAFITAPVFNGVAERELTVQSRAAFATWRAHLSRCVFLYLSLGATVVVVLLVLSTDVIPDWFFVPCLGLVALAGAILGDSVAAPRGTGRN